MTYLTSNKISAKRRARQAGVSLMLAVLVLAGITAVAFSIAAIVFVEIRASGDLLRTEPALYAVQSVTEEAFYSTSRSIDNFPFSTSINGVSLATAERTYDISPQTYVVYYNSATKLSLANPAAPFRNAYTTIKIDYVSPAAGTSVTAQLYQYQDNGQTGIAATQVLNSASPSWTITLASYANSANSEFEIILTTSNVNNSTVLITSSKTGTPSSGIPLVGRKTYDVTASYLGLTRKYTVSEPTFTPAAGATAGFVVNTSGTLNNNLAAYWKLDEASGTRVDVFGANNLTDNNSVGQAAGKQGNAGQFTTASARYLSHASNSTLQTGDISFTLGAWVYLDTKTAAMMPFGKDDGSVREYRLRYLNTTDRFDFTVYRPGNSQMLVTADNFGPVSVGTWYYVLVWHDAAADTLNISVNNGTPNSAATGGPLQAAGNAEFRVGARAFPASENYWNGRIDEVGFWKKVLTPQERTDLYNGGFGNTYNP